MYHSSRLEGVAKMGSWAREDVGQGGGRTRWMRQQLADQAILHLHVDKPGGTTGEQLFKYILLFNDNFNELEKYELERERW